MNDSPPPLVAEPPDSGEEEEKKAEELAENIHTHYKPPVAARGRSRRSVDIYRPFRTRIIDQSACMIM